MGLRKRWTKKGSPAQLRDNSESKVGKLTPAQLRGNSESKVGKLRVDRLADIALIILHSRESRMVVGYGAA